jgi:hypothetical protein
MVASSLSREKQAKVLNRISKLAPEVERATKGERVRKKEGKRVR